jgi:hypothetical protein
VNERIQVRVRFQDDIAALAAMSPCRAAPWHIFLPAKSNDTVTAVAGFDVDFGFVK